MRHLAPLTTLCVLGACGQAQSLTIDVGTVGTSPFERGFDIDDRGEITIDLVPLGGLVEVGVDCAPPERPDEVGFHFTIDAPGWPTEAGLARAGYWKLRAALPATPTRIVLHAEDGPASCKVHVAAVPSACGPREVYRSVEVTAGHVPPGPEPRSDWEAFPVSGNHYPTWAAWNTFYVAPIRTGYLIHDLEHGGLVLSYKCSSPSASTECATSANELQAAKTRFHQTRINITPDPRQPSPLAARAWRWAYLASCYDEDDLIDFMTRRFRHGREDTDADSVPAFDPTL